MPSAEYQSEKCDCCGMSTTYLLPIDAGSIEIIKAFIKAIKILGRNYLHPRNELEGSYLNSNQVGNLSRPRFHGLIAKVQGKSGYYCLTNKGVAFLKGAYIPKYAIISKQYKKQIGYFQEETHRITIRDFDTTGGYWEFPNFSIIDGQLRDDVPVQNRLFPLFVHN